ncbi:MAG TPA: glycosyltransferase family 4 protein [Longimicrobiaceae bacterium]|nr:glycosyltransferase family 4 protein [Longimicrobiaceae bacterium]
MISTPFVAVPPRDYGGTELVVHELVEGLVKRGHDVTLYATGDSETRARLRYWYAQAQWPPNIMPDVNHVSWAMAEVENGEFDIVHTHSAISLAFGRLVRNVPLVYTLHHVRDDDLSRFYSDFPEAHYVAISRDQASHEVDLPNLHVIHHGLNPDDYEWTDRPAEYVCFIGRFAPVKGAHTAIDVAARAAVPIRVAGEVHSVDKEFGDREMEPRFRQPHVTRLGTIGMKEKVPLLRDARALLVPIDWDEPFGLVMIEAMLSGCPVVAFPRGSVPEIVEDGITGFIVSDAAEMADVIRPGGPLDGLDRRRCRIRAVERFSGRRMVEDYERLFASILREPGLSGTRSAVNAA